MQELDHFVKLILSNDAAENMSFWVDEVPPDFFDPEDSIEFHASRLLCLVEYCSLDTLDQQQQRLGIKGRTKLAKLDFFLRYPAYLMRALKELNFTHDLYLQDYEEKSIESRMIRYRYGPWDDLYFDVFAYLTAKGLLEIIPVERVDHFVITDDGKRAVKQLSEDEAYKSLIARCQIIRESLANKAGTSLKNFIYQHFPEIVDQPIGSTIDV